MENARKWIGTSILTAPVTLRLFSGETILGPICVPVLPAVGSRERRVQKKFATGNGKVTLLKRCDNEECALRMPRVEIRELRSYPLNYKLRSHSLLKFIQLDVLRL